VQVFYQVWSRPIVTVNGAHLISRVIGLCGGRNVFAQLPLLAPEIDREAVLAADPEVVIASGAGDQRPAWLDDWRDFPEMRAVRNGQLYAMPADLLQRHTPRILNGAERLCAILEAARAQRAERVPRRDPGTSSAGNPKGAFAGARRAPAAPRRLPSLRDPVSAGSA